MSLDIEQPELTLRSLGEVSQPLKASAIDFRKRPIRAPAIVWSSDSINIAMVDQQGRVTAVANGETTVRAQADAVTDEVRVVVEQAARRIVITPSADTLRAVAESTTLRATVKDSANRDIEGAEIAWSNLAPETVTMVAAGADTAVFVAQAEGGAFVQAVGTAGGGAVDAAVRIEVIYDLTLDVSPRDPKLSRVGETLQFTASGQDSTGNPIANPRVTWSSSDSARVAVDSATGLATARDSGKATIRATHASGATDATIVEVAPPILDADVTTFQDSLPLGSTGTVSVTRRVENKGTLALGVRARLEQNSGWLSVTPDTLTLGPALASSINLDARATGVSEGDHADAIVLESQGAAGQPKRIPVLFRIFCQPADVTPDLLQSAAIASGDCRSRHRSGSLADYYRFTASAGDAINADMSTGAQTSLDTYLVLLDSLGAIVAFNDDCPGRGRNSCLRNVVLAADGRYTLEATTFAAATFTYSLSLVRQQSPALPTALTQSDPTGGIAVGGSTPHTRVTFGATGTDANVGDSLTLQVEVRSVGTGFTGAPTASGAPVANAAGGVAVSASATALQPGEYHWQARVCDQNGRCGSWEPFGGNPETSRDVAVSPTGLVLTVTPEAVLDSAAAGSTIVPNQTLSITNTGAAGPYSWTVAKKSTWLGLSSTTGSGDATITLSLNPTGLSADTHRDTVVVTVAGALGSPDTTLVTFVIQQPVIVVSPASFAHSTNAASGITFNDTVRISNSGTGALTWSATVDAPWVTFDNGKTSGSAPDELALTITPGTLPAGSHSATVTITAPGATGSPTSVPITLTVQQPVLAVSASAVTDSANVGTASRTRTLDVTNTGGGTMSWTVAKVGNAAWLTAAPTSGSAPATVTLTLGPSGLGAGTYNETLRFTSSETVNDPVDVAVQFHVRQPILQTTPVLVSDSVTKGVSTVRQHTLTVANGNGGFLAWKARRTHDSTWLAIAPDTANAPGTITVTFNSAGLLRGPHRDTIVVSSSDAQGSPDSIPLRLDVFERPNVPTQLGQFKSNGTMQVATGGVTDEASLVVKATLTDFDPGDQLVFEVEVRPIGTAFSDVATNTSAAVGSGGVASVTLGSFADNSSHHWRSRACDQTGRCSGWVSYGENLESSPDFSVNSVPQLPAAPTSLEQYQANGTTRITPPNGETNNSPGTVVLEGVVTDPDPGDLIFIEVEVEEGSFDGQPEKRGTTGVTTGNPARVTVSGLPDTSLLGLGNTPYRWRARACDHPTALNRCSAWTDFGGNSNTDFVVP